ncbi:PREDICTED: centrosomal protein of 131 kDa isoform X4 [Nanorana parkeri]|uniref:centrosomal protein of 131 kDa isoform X4 n=1 Tax=Nanorana parkeri TaxID=125878 RepID=UPI00085445A3|nr:PREDICTED: centrosomal protein of 131 kDa isoform X4 [Nanorana parkeri]
MQSSLGAPVQQGGGDNSGLALTGSQVSVTKRPSSAGSAKLISRSISVVTDTRSKGNSLKDSPGAINNLRRSNSTTQVTPGNSSLFSGDQPEDFLAFFESSSIGRKKLHGLAKTPPGRKTTWNVLDEQPRSLSVSSSARSARSVPGMKRKDLPALAPNFPANNRSNKGAVGNTVTTMVHNNYSSDDRGLSAKSSNQKTPSLNNQRSAAGEDPGSSFQKSQKNLSGTNNLGRNNTGGSSPQKRREVTTEEAERFILQVNNAAVTIQRWYRRQRQKNRAGEMAIKHMLASKKEERQQQPDENSFLKSQQTKEEERRRVREEKARQARRAAIQELQMKRAQKAIDTQRVAEEELALLVQSGKVGKKKTSCNTAMPPTGRSNKSKNNAGSRMQDTLECDSSGVPLFKPAPETRNHEQAVPVLTSTDQTPGDLEVAASAQSKTTLTDLLDTLKQLEEPEPLLDSKPDGKDKFSWIDGDAETSLTIDNLERLGQMMRRSQAEQKQIQNGTLLSEAKLQNIISFLDDMEKAEQERPRSSASNTHRGTMLSEEELTHLEQASAVATEVTSSMLKMRLELEEKRKALGLLQTALVQQRELTVRHVKQTEKELGYQLKQQSEQYESTIQRHLTFIDQLIDDKKTLSERCESLVTDLKQVDQKYASKIRQMQEQHDTEMKKLQELMTATEKVRREKWIDEKTRKIKEITVKGLEPEIQRLISKHKQEIRKLKALHEAELLQSDERAATRYVRQAEELRQNLEHEKEEVSQRAREQAKQRYEKQLAQEEQSLQEQRRRLYSEVAEEKERLNQQAARQRAELDELRKQLEDNCTLSTRMLKEEYEKGKEEQERRHQAEIKALKERLEIEKQAWEQNYMKKEEAWLLTRERELKAEVRKGRDKEIELVIQRLESEMSTAREECERAAENRIKRVREKYESELQELEQSERKLQDRCNQLKERATELEGEQIRLQGLLKQREQEVEDIRKITDRLNEERKSLSDVIRQEFADRLVVTEEENKRLKIEASEAQARHRLELERITREKEEELEEVHKRVKSAIVKKEETVNNLRKQCEAAVKRADHLEALLEQQRKQLLSK